MRDADLEVQGYIILQSKTEDTLDPTTTNNGAQRAVSEAVIPASGPPTVEARQRPDNYANQK